MKDAAKTQEPKGKVKAVMPEGWPPIVGMTLEECAAALRIDPKTCQNLIRTKGLPAMLCGKGWRISPKALDEWLASGTGEGRKQSGSVAEGELVQGGDPCNLADFRNVSKD